MLLINIFVKYLMLNLSLSFRQGKRQFSEQNQNRLKIASEKVKNMGGAPLTMMVSFEIILGGH